MGMKKIETPSPFGSHESMALDPLVQVVTLGYPRCEYEVVVTDGHGTYTTLRDRLDSGLADPRRYSGRERA